MKGSGIPGVVVMCHWSKCFEPALPFRVSQPVASAKARPHFRTNDYPSFETCSLLFSLEEGSAHPQHPFSSPISGTSKLFG